MSSRAIVVNYSIPPEEQQFDANGFFILGVNTMFTDPALGKKKIGQALAHLDPLNPATWNASIEAAIMEISAYPDFQYMDLTPATIYMPTYS